MNLSHEFVVRESPDVIWAYFQDVPAVAACLPGAELSGITELKGYEGRLTVTVGSMSLVFEGRGSLDPDPSMMRAVFEGSGVDKKGGSRGRVKLRYAVHSDPAGSRVSIDADISLAGPVAQFGRTGLITETSKRLISEFVVCLERKLNASPGGSDL